MSDNLLIVKVNKATIDNGNAQILLQEIKDFLKRNRKLKHKEAEKLLSKYLKKYKLKETPERVQILNLIFHINKEFTAKDILIITPKGISISKTAIYKTINLFKDIGIVKLNKVGIQNKRMTCFFEICDK